MVCELELLTDGTNCRLQFGDVPFAFRLWLALILSHTEFLDCGKQHARACSE